MAHFFTADPHFGHAASIKHEQRPFVTVEEMNATLVSNFAAVIDLRFAEPPLNDVVRATKPATRRDVSFSGTR